MRGIDPGSYMYFVHSFAVLLDDPSDLVAETDYAGLRFCSVLSNGNVLGCQFHPEKSGSAGLQLIGKLQPLIDRPIWLFVVQDGRGPAGDAPAEPNVVDHVGGEAEDSYRHYAVN